MARRRQVADGLDLLGRWGLVSVLILTGACIHPRHGAFHPKQRRLYQAARDGDFRTVKCLVGGNGANVNFSFPDGSTALQAAARAGHAEIVAYLVEQGADPNGGLKRRAWKYPLQWASEGRASAPDPSSYQRIIEALVAFGADSRMGPGGRVAAGAPSSVSSYASVTALDFANTGLGDSDLERLVGFVGLESLNLAGTHVRGEGLLSASPFRTLLYLNLASTPFGDDGIKYLSGFSCLKALDLSNTNISLEGLAELRRALPECRIEPLDTMPILERRAPLDGLPGFRASYVPFINAAGAGDTETLGRLTERRESGADFAGREGSVALRYAALHGRVEAVRFLLNHGADANDATLPGTPLHYATRQIEPYYSVGDKEETVRLLLMRGADSRAPYSDSREYSPWPSLQLLMRLDLSGTSIDDADLCRLKGFTHLEELDLRGAKVTEAGVADLMNALPGCRIHR